MNLLYTPTFNTLNQPLLNQKIPFNGFFYTYRLTYTDPVTKEKFYYVGYRKGNKKDPREDGYFSSSDVVKKLIKEQGVQCLKKKIIGVYLLKQEALLHEINYHARLEVNLNTHFLNQARQLTLGFQFDPTGSTQTKESNLKRSKTLKGVKKMTPEGRKALAEYQRNVRIRSEKELQKLREDGIARTHQLVTCPHCGKVGTFLSMKCWHFDNCPKSPNPSPESVNTRQKLRERFQQLNKNHPKHKKEKKPSNS